MQKKSEKKSLFYVFHQIKYWSNKQDLDPERDPYQKVTDPEHSAVLRKDLYLLFVLLAT